ncbi:MAG: hypothetical protein Fur0046_14440 [Cyanobacteria bacterium J069]|nr:MAG: hypothetical protein D6742_17330 [Cyanobacteria bacterium J069]
MTQPKFASRAAWEQANLLMQPVFIRVLDNLRKAIERSPWKSTYRNDPIWPEGVSAETQQQVLKLQQQLTTATAEDAPALQAELSRLPQPHPGYVLCLEHQTHQVNIDLWQLCYQVCFRNYSPILSLADSVLVEVDTSLLDDTGDVDWQQLDAKTAQLVEQIFASLPAVS